MSNYISFGYTSIAGGKTIGVGVIADKGVVQVSTNGGREIGGLIPVEAAELAERIARAAVQHLPSVRHTTNNRQQLSGQQKRSARPRNPLEVNSIPIRIRFIILPFMPKPNRN